jgi:uncharacterized protein (TIGR00725 family)
VPAPAAPEPAPAAPGPGPYVAVVGPGEATADEGNAAEEIGRALAQAGAIVVTGGLGGVMEGACRGARAQGGVTVGILPGHDRAAANPAVTLAIPTGLGELRNGLVVRSADAVVAVGGAYGTLSEVALALKTGVPVVGLNTWAIDGIERVATPAEAAARALQLAAQR